jgi:hypothetical protein
MQTEWIAWLVTSAAMGLAIMTNAREPALILLADGPRFLKEMRFRWTRNLKTILRGTRKENGSTLVAFTRSHSQLTRTPTQLMCQEELTSREGFHLIR